MVELQTGPISVDPVQTAGSDLLDAALAAADLLPSPSVLMSLEEPTQPGQSVDLPIYSGPLDLLLKLVRQHEIDIYDIPIASITEQYLAELAAMENRNLLIAGDFLLMAATLLEIKSAMMLPAPPRLDGDADPADPRAGLALHLLEYQALQSLAQELGRLEAERRLVWNRPFNLSGLPEPLPPPLANLRSETLCRSFQAILERLDRQGEPVTSVPREQISLRMTLAAVMAELGSAARRGLTLEEIVRVPEGRWVVIVRFLALLELLRAGRIRIQEEPGGPRFWLTRIPHLD
jgi:segregation and condensation protein A